MLRLLLHLILFTALLTQQLQMVVVCAVFKAQQSYLIKNECVNRNNPHNECKAHCQLSKRMNEQEEQKSSSEISFKESEEFVAQFHKPVLTAKYFTETGLTLAGSLFIGILTGFCECYYPPPEQV